MDGHWEHTEGHENICSLDPRVLPPGTAWLVTFVKSSVFFVTKMLNEVFFFTLSDIKNIGVLVNI